MSDRSQSLEVVVGEIDRYMRSHPGAVDTLEGVAKWWLARQRYEDALETVADAMAVLVERGRVEQTTLPDGRAIYRYVGPKETTE